MTFDINNVTLRLYRSNAVQVVAWVVFVLIAATVLSIMFWCWLSHGESNSTTIRNLSLVIAAIIGLPLAIWRSIVAERQSETAQPRRCTCPVASTRGGLIPCRQWRTQTCGFPLTVPLLDLERSGNLHHIRV